MNLTQADHAGLDTFWAAKPAPRTPIRPDQYYGAVTVAITCRVCGKRESQLTSANALLCRVCLADLNQAEATVQSRLEAVTAARDLEMDRWVALQDALDDTLADRWTRLTQDYQRVNAQLRRAETGPQTDAANLAEKRDAYAVVINRIVRTIDKGGPLADLLKAQDVHNAALQKLADQRQALEMALSEIDCAGPEGAPF